MVTNRLLKSHLENEETQYKNQHLEDFQISESMIPDEDTEIKIHHFGLSNRLSASQRKINQSKNQNNSIPNFILQIVDNNITKLSIEMRLEFF